jgi:hemerythrin-like domain-containing protein
MSEFATGRRNLLLLAGAASAGLVFAGDAGPARAKEKAEKEIGAVEDLMREHGVIRRALLVYYESAPRIRASLSDVDPGAINRTAKLFRSFGEDYHERMLEEALIFPAVRKAGGLAALLVDTLIQQHNRGREITDYILAVTGRGAIGPGDAEPLARAFETLFLMYANHAAREDTIVFPAWKNTLSDKQLQEMGEKFEDIEHRQFGKDGFTSAAAQIATIEQALGYADLAKFTAPPPPKV